MLTTWQHCWRNGFAPQLSTAALRALERALETDDARLIQGATTQPAPLACVADWPVEAACLIAYGAWQGDGLLTVGEIEEFFAVACYQCDVALGEAAGCRYLMNAFDDLPREEIFPLLLAEVRRTLRSR